MGLRVSPAAAAGLIRWIREHDLWRREKDRFFATQAGSPLPPPTRFRFQGLPYYPPNRAFVLSARFRRSSSPEPVRLATSRDGQTRPYRRFARAAFQPPGGPPLEVSLYARPEEIRLDEAYAPHELFLPFRDETNAAATYPEGRYMEVLNPFEAPSQLESQGLIDFNWAYNPFCAYNRSYACPMPLHENWLKTKVEAGEKYDPSLSDDG